MNQRIIQKIVTAYEKDPEILIDKDKVEESLGTDARYLEDILDITKSDLIRLEREGFAMKARYATESKRGFFINDADGKEIGRGKITGPHRIRWLIFKDVLNGKV